MNNEIKLKISIDNKEAIASLQLTDENIKEIYKSFKYGKQEVNGLTTAISQGFNNAREILQGFREITSLLSASFGEQLESYHKQEVANIQLQTAMKQTGNYTEENYNALLSYSSQLQKTTIFGDDLTTTVMAQLQAMGLNVEQTKQATLQAANLASIMGTDLNAAARAMADLFNGNVGMIGRYVKGLDEAVIKSGDLDAIISMLNERIGGQAEAIGKSSVGALAKYSNAIGDIKEESGKLIANGLQPLATALSDILGKINTASPQLSGIIGLLGTATVAFVTLRVTGIMPAVSSFQILGVTLTGLKATLVSTGIGAAIVALGYAFVELANAYNKWQQAKAGGENTINSYRSEIAKEAAGKSKTEIEQLINDSEKQIDELSDELKKIHSDYEASLQIQKTKDKDDNVYINKIETDTSKQLRLQADSKRELIKLERERINVLKSALEPKPKMPNPEAGQFEEEKKELMLAEQHKIKMAEIEGKSDLEISRMKIAFFYKMIELYKKYKQDSTELTYQALEEEAKMHLSADYKAEKAAKTSIGLSDIPAAKGMVNVKDERPEGDVSEYQRFSAKQEIDMWAEKEKAKVGIYRNADELRKAIDEEALRRKQELAETEKQIEEEKEKAKIEATVGALNYIGGAVAEHTLLGKAASVAQAGINTYEAATKALTAGPIMGPILAGIITALGLSNVAKIMSVQTPKHKRYEYGGRLPEGELGFVEGYRNELIAPEQTFENIMRYELIPKVINNSNVSQNVIDISSLEKKFDKMIDTFENKDWILRGEDIYLTNKKVSSRKLAVAY